MKIPNAVPHALSAIAVALCCFIAFCWIAGPARAGIFDAPPYWYKSGFASVAPEKPIFVHNLICNGKPAWGCAQRSTGQVSISLDAPPVMWSCIIEHEAEMHLRQGYDHNDPLMSAAGPWQGGVWCNEHTFMPVPISTQIIYW